MRLPPRHLIALGSLVLTLACSNGGPTIISPVFRVGGTVSGLDGTLVLQNNGGDDLTVTADGSFAFSTRLSTGDGYLVSVLSQPPAQTCAVSNGSGIVGGVDVTSVTVACIDNP
jgi:hypothetical protein